MLDTTRAPTLLGIAVKTAPMVFLTLTLTACATPEVTEIQMVDAGETCRSLAYKDGTDAMRDCIERVYRSDRQAEAERSAAPPTPGAPIVPRTPPVPGLMLCHRIGSGICR